MFDAGWPGSDTPLLRRRGTVHLTGQHGDTVEGAEDLVGEHALIHLDRAELEGGGELQPALAELPTALMTGMTFEELPAAEGASLVRKMHHPIDFAVDPLPNLLFTRDSSVWVGDRVAGALLLEETTLVGAVRVTRRLSRSKSCTWMARSSFWICLLRGGWVILRRSAARPKWSSSATATKPRSWSSEYMMHRGYHFMPYWAWTSIMSCP